MGLSNTRVVNIRDSALPEGWMFNNQYVYIGRASCQHKASRWSNPFRIDAYKTRSDVLGQFQVYFYERLREQFFREATLRLAGKTLVCWCKPLPCHGDIIAAYLDTQVAKGLRAWQAEAPESGGRQC